MLEITDRNFEAEVLQSVQPVVVDFWAEWCGPCRMMGPVFSELEKELGSKVKFAKLNVDNNINLAQMYNVNSIPSFLIFKGGEVAKTTVGYADKVRMKETIESAL